MTKDEALDLALEAAYLAGFNASGEGYNGEYPFRDHGAPPEQDAGWIKNRDNELTAIKQARALDKKAENARELGLDYEPVPDPDYWPGTKPVQKKCDCAAHSAADCVCGAWGKSAAAPVQEPSCKDCRIDKPCSAKGKDFDVCSFYVPPPAAPVQEPVAWRWKNNGEDKWLNEYVYLDRGGPDCPEECEPLYTTSPNVATPLAAQRPWVGLSDEEIGKACGFAEYTTDSTRFALKAISRAIEAKLKEKNTP